jgi:glutaminyl-peptide cyclotransferase
VNQRSKGILIVVSFLFFSLAWIFITTRKGLLDGGGVMHFKARIVSIKPHDPGAFTQGLVFDQGSIYESTGLEGQSSLRLVELDTGKVLRRVDLPGNLFGEGLALVHGNLVQLTWRNQIARVYDTKRFRRVGEFTYSGEGWGLCFDGQHLIMSDGSEFLTVRDTNTFKPLKEIRVTLNGESIRGLNELEYANGKVYANLWPTDVIAGIEMNRGHVVSLIDAKGLLSKEERLDTDVLNGIAYNPDQKTFLLTGKRWPKMFEVVFVQ